MVKISNITIHDCPRVRYVRDEENGCLEIRIGTMRLTIFGPDDSVPAVVEQTARQAGNEHMKLLAREFRAEEAAS